MRPNPIACSSFQNLDLACTSIYIMALSTLVVFEVAIEKLALARDAQHLQYSQEFGHALPAH